MLCKNPFYGNCVQINNINKENCDRCILILIRFKNFIVFPIRMKKETNKKVSRGLCCCCCIDVCMFVCVFFSFHYISPPTAHNKLSVRIRRLCCMWRTTYSRIHPYLSQRVLLSPLPNSFSEILSLWVSVVEVQLELDFFCYWWWQRKRPETGKKWCLQRRFVFFLFLVSWKNEWTNQPTNSSVLYT